ncbi:uncharacterized protein LOC135078136 isoform X1 [Ostrinia nubilalis]|uniref:uncharacterized protein LOC135078136 isoform X1 n=1 Tax=Ostrinia nubilalis TaxID=29057 RepID=UPI0030822DF7
MLINREKMPLPMVKRCCGFLPLEVGFYAVCLLSILGCVANITAGAWNLPRHREREPEDNLISMSMVMFSALSTIGNLVAGAGAYLRRPGYLQLAIVFNSVFILCIFLIAVVTCLFSPELKKSHFLDSAGNIALVVIMFFAGAAYSVYYLAVVNSLYRTMKDDGDSAIPI